MIEAIFLGVFAVLGLVVFPRVWLKAIQQAREAMVSEIVFRTPTEEEAARVKALDAQSARQSALSSAGFEQVGDIVLVIEATGRVHIALRVFIDARKTTCAYIAATQGYGLIQFESYTDTQELVTSHARSDNYIEAGPTSQRQFVHSNKPVAEAYRKHLDLAAAATVTFTNLDEVVRAMRTAHDQLLAWRATQPPDELLDRDLRKILGGWYRFYGRWIARRIQTVPRASVHRS